MYVISVKGRVWLKEPCPPFHRYSTKDLVMRFWTPSYEHTNFNQKFELPVFIEHDSSDSCSEELLGIISG